MRNIQNSLFAITSGVLLSLPWNGLLPGWILFAAFIPLLLVEDNIFRHRASSTHSEFFIYAFLTFFIWNVATTWWILHATVVGMILVVVLNASLMAFVWWLFHRFRRNFSSDLARFGLIFFWLGFEHLHYNWDIEWPWLTLGNGFANQVRLIQWYEYTGVLGGSLWVLVANLILFQVFTHNFKYEKLKVARAGLFFLLMVCVPIIVSNNIYRNYSETGKELEIVILQPNIDPYSEKFLPEKQQDQIDKLALLADSLVISSTDLILGPETALPPIVESDSLYKASYLRPFYNLSFQYPDLVIILGANTERYYQNDEKLSSTVRWDSGINVYYDVYNSAIIINSKSNVEFYHKTKLVSGVEKMPFSKYFSFIEKYIVDLGGTTGSLGRQTKKILFKTRSGQEVAPVICFESIFGDYIAEKVKAGAKLILLMTNDGWWKDSPGYRQHLAYARLRAVENRRSIARSANTGISALINQRGDLVQLTEWWTETAIKGQLKLNDEITFYTRYGGYIGRISSFTSVLLLLFFFIQQKIGKSSF